MAQFLSLLLFALAVAVNTAAAGEQPPFNVTTKRSDDRVDIRAEKGIVVFSVHSPAGISRAVIERAGETWPEAVVLQLHLKGLEHLRVSNGKVMLEASVPNQGGKARVWRDGREDESLDAKSPYWMDVRVVGGGDKTADEFPLRNGFFEFSLPRAFCRDNPKSITVSWIDFYRN